MNDLRWLVGIGVMAMWSALRCGSDGIEKARSLGLDVDVTYNADGSMVVDVRGKDQAISGGMIDALCDLRAIGTLDLWGATGLEADVVGGLRRIECRALCVSNSDITDDGLKVLFGGRNLVYADLSETRLGDAAMAWCASTPIEDLNITDTLVSRAGIRALLKCKRLRALSVSGSRVDDSAMEDIAGLHQLEYLAISDAPISDHGLRELRRAAGLREIFLTGCPVTCTGFCPGSDGGFEALQSVNVEECPYTDEGVGEILRLPSLSELCLCGEGRSDGSWLWEDSLSSCDRVAELTSLSLIGCGVITDALSPQLLRFRKLKSLELVGTQVTWNGVRLLGELELEYLGVNWGVLEAAGDELRRVFPKRRGGQL